jgi:ribose transport system permease protein
MSTQATAEKPAGPTLADRFKSLEWNQYIIYIGFVVLFIFFAVTLGDRGFLSTGNLLNILRQSANIAIMAVAMTYVLSAKEIDLSVGAVAGLASVTTAMAIASFGVLPGIFVGLATGLLVGSINGLLVTWIGIPSFLVTLAMLSIARGFAQWISDTAAIPILDDGYNFFFGGGNLGPVPILVLWALLIGAIGHLGLRKSTFGRQVLATGGNTTAALFSGIKTKAIQFRVLLLSSTAAALAGMLYAGRLTTGRFQLGEGDELTVIAAAVLGGTSLFGGLGTVVGSVAGAVMIALINNGLILFGLPFSQQLIARGLIIILAVALARR